MTDITQGVAAPAKRTPRTPQFQNPPRLAEPFEILSKRLLQSFQCPRKDQNVPLACMCKDTKE